MKRLYSILILSLFVLPLLADNVSVERAQDIAQQFYSALAPNTRSISSQWEMVWNGESVQTRDSHVPAFYVFNRMEGGFVIIAGDDIVNQ